MLLTTYLKYGYVD